MNKNLIKTLIITIMLSLSVFFINIDEAKADIPYCDANDQFEKAVACDYPNKGLFTTELDLTVYFGKTTSNKYCAEIKKIKLTSWNDMVTSDDATNKEIVAFDLTNDTMKLALTGKSCPTLKFVNDYNGLTTKTTKFTVSDKDMNSLACTASQLISLGSECWVLPGENFKEISVEEMKSTINQVRRSTNDITVENILGYGTTDGVQIGDPCNTLEINGITDILGKIFWIISIAAIIILIVMTSINFIQAITGSDEEKLRDAIKHLRNRIIVVLILFLLPFILQVIIDIVNENAPKTNGQQGTIQIGKDGEAFCDITK